MEKRIAIYIFIVASVFILFLLRLWDLQVIRGDKYRKITESNRMRIVEITAPRGIIYDRHNTPLVENIPSFDISIFKEDLPRNPERLAALGKLIGLKPSDIRKRVEQTNLSSLEPVKLRQDISFKEVAMVEARKIDFPGLHVDAIVSREYIYGKFASHVIGYLGRLTLEQIKDPEFSDVPRKAFVGQRGIEKIYDSLLRGEAGKKIIEVDATGKLIRSLGIKESVKGSDIRLTIDMRTQQAAEKNLRNKAGAVVVLDSDTGEVLALASSPSFNPNLFSRGIEYSEWERLLNNPKKPFLNRAIQSQYPPGSTFKIVSAIAALEEGVLTDKTRFRCNGSIELGREFRCWKKEGHGSTDLYRAIVESCDVYFYEIGKKIDIETLSQYAFDFGLGTPVGIDLENEKPGIVPTAEWKKRRIKERWYKGETLNAVIGQGYLTSTPIQVARLMSVVINGGRLYSPYLLMDPQLKDKSEKRIEIRKETVNLIKKALSGVVSEDNGTGKRARSDVVSIGGKTGTTQVIAKPEEKRRLPEKFRDHAWFVAYAPEEDPEITVAVFVEHGGHGSTAAAPIAKDVIEAYFKCRLRNAECGTDISEIQKLPGGRQALHSEI